MKNLKNFPQELEEKLDEINSWMFSGDQREVAKRARVDEGTVSKIINKKMKPSKKVLDAAIEVMNENKNRFQITPKMKVA